VGVGGVRLSQSPTPNSRTIRLDLSYEGTHYHGFGLQPKSLTIQEVVEEALAAALGEQVRVTAAGRTDAGVHASGQVLSFKTSARLSPEQILRAANARLPEDIMVERAMEMPDHFDARRSARGRRYRYTIWNRPRPNLWWRRLSWHVPGHIDSEAMQEATALLIGRRDFSAFAGGAAREPAERTTVRTVRQAEWRAENGFLRFTIGADAFLRHMVRGVVGTLIWVGRGKLDAEGFKEIVASCDRRRAGPNAPPMGLMLVAVEYPDELGGTSGGAGEPRWLEG
jgi:tRNA pseudouridine38-40 synthase